VNYPTFVSFVDPEPDGVECRFSVSACGYILGQQWIYTENGIFNILCCIDGFDCVLCTITMHIALGLELFYLFRCRSLHCIAYCTMSLKKLLR